METGSASWSGLQTRRSGFPQRPRSGVMTILRQQGAVVRYHDPHVPRFRDSEGVEYASVPLDELLEDSSLMWW